MELQIPYSICTEIQKRGLPKYNEETELAMKEAIEVSKSGKGFKDIDLLFKELDD